MQVIIYFLNLPFNKSIHIIMKTIINIVLSMLILFAFSLTSFAGDKDRGIRAGYLSGQIKVDGENAFDNNLSSFYLGFYKDKRIIPALRVGAGLEYLQTGSQQDNDNKYQLGYIGVPIKIQGKVGPIYALTGVSPSFKISEKMTLLGNDFEIPDDDKAKVFDLPLFVGGGFQIMMIGIEARYYIGLTEIQDKTKNQYLQVGLTLSF